MWNEQKEYQLMPLRLTLDNLVAPSYKINFYEDNLYFLNKVPANKININNYTSQFKIDNIIKDYYNLHKYKSQINTNIDILSLYIQYLNILKNQSKIINNILNNLNKQKIFEILSDYNNFTKLVNYIDLEKLPIECIPYIIPHLYKYCLYSIKDMEKNCSDLVKICNNIYRHDQSLFILIFTERFNNKFITNTQRIIKDFSIKEIDNFIKSTAIGKIIKSWTELEKIFNEYYNSLLLLDKI